MGKIDFGVTKKNSFLIKLDRNTIFQNDYCYVTLPWVGSSINLVSNKGKTIKT